MTPAEPTSDTSERQANAEATSERLFGSRGSSAADNDPELMEILRRFIFGDVFDTGVLDDRSRELITVTVLACQGIELPLPDQSTVSDADRYPKGLAAQAPPRSWPRRALPTATTAELIGASPVRAARGLSANGRTGDKSESPSHLVPGHTRVYIETPSRVGPPCV